MRSIFARLDEKHKGSKIFEKLFKKCLWKIAKIYCFYHIFQISLKRMRSIFLRLDEKH